MQQLLNKIGKVLMPVLPKKELTITTEVFLMSFFHCVTSVIVGMFGDRLT